MINPTVYCLASDTFKVMMLQKEFDRLIKRKDKQSQDDAKMLKSEIARLKKKRILK
jgi:hypothetical protein